MLHDAADSILVLVDLQARLMPAIRHGEQVVRECVRLATIARRLGVPVVGTEQSPGSLGANLAEVTALCDRTFAKDSFDACADGLCEILPATRRRVIVAGCEAHVCVLQTALGLLGHGREVTLLVDATGSRKAIDHDTAVARLAAAGALPATVEMVAFEWLRSARHEHFRDALRHIKSPAIGHAAPGDLPRPD
ncbi:isochorismatase [Cupriavidus sp. USMAHM13]|uniref:isochorismatase family protein n=1 Tax=Cupriavidus sp. USMAHM13 TaxID=1389192 RepID=UPI0008A68649|nr:isochorismatase family protein [Cupriavidus sp. USMAHM13]AOZ03437.1 isochorismatase [Cupriavidus sp. USMAHM13]